MNRIVERLIAQLKTERDEISAAIYKLEAIDGEGEDVKIEQSENRLKRKFKHKGLPVFAEPRKSMSDDLFSKLARGEGSGELATVPKPKKKRTPCRYGCGKEFVGGGLRWLQKHEADCKNVVRGNGLESNYQTRMV